ncbi:MAG: permease prefix domain 1-containing protein [Lachnospiraceae bacterium]|nr:permease prefix domain 1-containing protein [Lachnospiraceae bacterium]
METIKNYLESMFANLPNSAEVRKAKNELLQMMEDKYNELIEEGKNENEAVGTVISEFGNLEELAEELGLEEEVKIEKAELEVSPRRYLAFEEVKDYIRDRAKVSLGIALGVGLCILSVCGPIFTSSVGFIPDAIGVVLMFVSIAFAVVLFVGCGLIGDRWKYLEKELCSIDYATANYVNDEKSRYHSIYVIQLTIGILLCACCWIPLVLFDGFNGFGFAGIEHFLETVGILLLMVLCAIGVFLIVQCSITMNTFDFLLKLNDRETVSGNYVRSDYERYDNPISDGLMQVYWPTVRAIYLIWSFLTFAWYKTWIIWPVAVAVHAVLRSLMKKEEEA